MCVGQNQQQKKKIARQFYTTSIQKCSNVRLLLSITFPQGFRISKNIWHPTSGSGGKKTVKRYIQSEQTDTQTDISNYRKHRPRGPMLWKSLQKVIFLTLSESRKWYLKPEPEPDTTLCLRRDTIGCFWTLGALVLYLPIREKPARPNSKEL